MADTLVKKPKLIVGTQSQVKAEMGDNDIGFATDIEFYNKVEIDEQYTSIITYVGDKDREIKSDITQLDTNIRTVGDWVNAKDESGNRATLTTEAQDAYRAINELNAKIGEGGGASLPILMRMWSDYVINDMSWLRADTFSWQSGDTYKSAYNHLVADSKSGIKYYAWARTFDGEISYTTTETPKTNDITYYKDTDGEFKTYRTVMEVDTNSIYDSASYELVRDSSKDETAPQKKTDTIGDITITYYEADDGHKICLPDQESNIVALYEATGVAWYFILDEENKQFKLPRENKDGKYLYFYVGNFTQEAIEQTAGLNAELFNGKADVSRVEVLEGYDYVVESQSPTADNGYTWYRKYKSGWVEQGGKLSGRNITFPIQFSLLPTVGTSIVNSDTNVVSNNHINGIETTGFNGFATSMNAGWTGSARDMNGYWTAFGFATQE